MPTTRTLAAGLCELGFTPTQVGRVLLPNGSNSSVYITGRRVLLGEREPGPEELRQLCVALRIRVTIDAAGVRVAEVA